MEKEQFENKIDIASVLQKYGATDMEDLHLGIYLPEDQRLMESGGWDYNDDSSLVNRIHNDLQAIDPETLSEEDSYQYRAIHWFWNHHAISCAICRYQDFEAAKKYTEVALSYLDTDHPNQITGLFALLLEHKFVEAQEYIDRIDDTVEKDTGKYMLSVALDGWKSWFLVK